MQEVVSFLEQYQSAISTLIVGAVGFLGIGLTLSKNAKLAKTERNAKLDDERRTMRIALLEELKIIRTAITEGIKTAEDGIREGSDGVYVPTSTMSDVYEAFIPRIGLLPEVQVRKVMMAYLSHRAYRQNFVLLRGVEVYDEHRVLMPGAHFATFKTMTENMLPHLNEAIAILS